MAVTLNEGNTNKLVITIPAKGDTDWAGVFQAAMQAISDHDHSGNGNGAKLNGSSLDDGCISTSKIVDDAVTTAKILDANVTTAKLADLNVTTAKLADNSVTNAKMGSDIPLATLSNVSSTAPTAGQVLKWSGTEWAPGTDASAAAGTVVLANQTDVNSYTPTPGDVISITATTDLTFSTELNGVVILKANDESKLTFNNNLSSCVIKTRGDIDFKNLNTDGTDIVARKCDINCKDLDVRNSALNSTINILTSSIVCSNIDVTSVGGDDQANLGTGTNVTCALIAHIGTFGGNKSLAQGLYIKTGTLQGSMRVGTANSLGNVITASRGTGTSSSYQVRVEDSGGTALINGNYPYPFTANATGIDTNVITLAKRGSNQSISSSSETQVVFDSEQSDVTESYNNSTGVFTAKVKGDYMVTCSMEFGTLTNNEPANVEVKKNSAYYIRKAVYYFGGQDYGHANIAHIIPLDIGDTISFFIDTQNDSSYTVDVNSSISISKIN